MRDTETLIDQLAKAGATTSGNALLRFVAPLLVVAVICAGGVALVLDGAFAPIAEGGFGPLLVKWGFAGAVLLLSATTLWALGKPGRRAGQSNGALMVPFVLVALLLAVELAVGGREFPGATWQQCLIAMASMSPVAFIGAVMAVRWLAPTNLNSAGLAAGLFGGAVAMAAYAPFCPEHGIAYLAVFYCLPTLAMAGLGWILGPRLLRW